MSDRLVIAAGGIGSFVAAICCFTPIPAVAFAALGLTAWLAHADYVLFPLLFVSLGLLALGLYRLRSATQTRAPELPKPKQGIKP